MSKDELELINLTGKRERYYQKLQITFDLIKSLPQKEDVFLARAERCPEDSIEFNVIQDRLAVLKQVLAREMPITSVSTAYDELYFEVIATSKNILQQRLVADTSVNAHNSNAAIDVRPSRPKLPPIDIPKFNGEIEKFPAFQSLFETLVHNTDLSAIQKFSFLRSYLDGPALAVISGFDLTESNYQLAYAKLVKRYTDHRIVGNFYFKELLQFKSLADGSAGQLRRFLDVFCVRYEALKALDIKDLSDFMIFTIGLGLLDTSTRRLFEEKNAKTDFPSFVDLKSFVEDQYKVSFMMGPSSRNSAQPSSCIPKTGLGARSVTKSFFSDAKIADRNGNSQSGLSPLVCPLCKMNHRLFVCTRFRDMDPLRRLDAVKAARSCYACFGSHARSHCQSRFTCRECGSRDHHTLLHHSFPTKSRPVADRSGTAEQSSSSLPGSATATNTLSCRVSSPFTSRSSVTGLLGTVRCRVRSGAGEWVPCRLVVVTASESSFITESLVQTLGLSRARSSVNVVGVGSTGFVAAKGSVTCHIAPRDVLDHSIAVNAIVMNNISSHLPKVPIDPDICRRFRHLKLADPDFGSPGPIDILLGVQHYADILSEDLVHIRGDPMALSTIFGFLIMGKVPSNSEVLTSHSMLACSPDLDQLITRFWESEEVLPSNSLSTPADDGCDAYFEATTVRDESGRYSVSLPFHNNKPPESLGSTREIARKRLYGVERRLIRDPNLLEQYNSCLQDYIDQGHMRVARSACDYIMTHHAVVRESSTTRVRVVFNGSEKSDSGKSLNQFLKVGPKLQADIGQILLLFRVNPVALIGDIKQMFRQIGLNEPDRKYTHLLWRSDTTLPVSEWELTTLPFGLASSPYLAQRTVQQLVKDEGHGFPHAAQVLKSCIYVDDVVCSAGSAADAICLYQELVGLFQRGGFSLRKFASNDRSVLVHIPLEHQEGVVDFESSTCVKLLGFGWDPQTDEFRYRISDEPAVITKRGILSQVARIFDVNGYLTPVTFWIKHLLQQLWLVSLGWDEELPSDLRVVRQEFYSQFSVIADLRIPRYFSLSSPCHFTIVGFCDASERGYAACLYLRVESEDRRVVVNLVKAKSRVAPLKTTTIPRLELNGAVLLARLLQSCTEFLSSLPGLTIVCYSDSTTVISWLRTPPHTLKTYVSNRVVTITDAVPVSCWRHVPGVQNPADLGSRGIFPKNLVGNLVWWQGPDFLRSPLTSWPNCSVGLLDPIPEVRDISVSLVSSEGASEESIFDGLMAEFSFLSVQRIVAYVMRFARNSRSSRERRVGGELSCSEMASALSVLVVSSQRQYYADVFKAVERDSLPRGALRTLNPFIGSDGCLRVGGRLARAPLPEGSRHPVLLHRRSDLARLICVHFHLFTLHGGPKLVQSLIQRRFWIPGVRQLLRTIIFRCIRCYRFKVKPLEPLMSDLPSLRFQKGRAFTNVGVDLAGPYSYKESMRRNARIHKCWVVLYICLSTRAVYLDLVVDLSTSAFLNTLDRFVSRRGIPARICSDMGTNFVGAARGIKEVHDLLMQESEEIRRFCSLRNIVWQFNPPAAPNFGGSWEAAVKSAKHHLKRILTDRPLTFDEFATLLARIEAILNSRPLGYLSNDATDGYDYLTPGHFLVGAPLLLSRPEIDLTEDRGLCDRWQLLTRSVQDFWKRWSVEYLHTLVQRTKWNASTPNLLVGRLVLVADNKLPPNAWLLGRVVECLPGPDGVVRVVRLRTASGERVRPVNKLCLLPFLESS